MALNVNYQGLVKDKDSNEVECKYQAYVPSISKWSDIRVTEESQYNVNFGDGDLKTQSGSISIGEIILICFWIGADERSERLDQFSVVRFSYTGSDSTIQDVQILPPHSPSCSFGLPASGLVGNSIYVTSYASLTYQWTHSNYTHYQRPSWYGGSIFDFLSIIHDDFLFNEEYSAEKNNTYMESGDYTVKHRVINSYDLQSVCEKPIRIKYFHPIPYITFSPENLVIGEPLGIADSVTDDYSRITNIEHIFDGELVEENMDLIFAYAKTLSVFRKYIAEQKIHWNDGFDDKTITVTASPNMINQPPIIDLTVFKTDENGLEGLHKAIVQARDREGPVVRLNWKIFYLDTNSILPNPYFICTDDGQNNTFNKIYDSNTDMSVTILDLLFAIKGTYKIDVTAYDEQGLSSTDSQVINVEEACVNEEVSPGDCDDLEERIAEAIRAYEREHQLQRATQRREELSECKLVVVQDSLAEDNGIGAPYGAVENSGISGEVEGGIDGEPVVGTGSNSGSISGN